MSDTVEVRNKNTGEYTSKKIVNAPAVHSDEIDPTESYATDERKMFDSKSALLKHYDDNGYECTGGDHLTGKAVSDWKYKADRDKVKDDIAEAMRKVKWGMTPINDKEREKCLREERKYQKYCRDQRG